MTRSGELGSGWNLPPGVYEKDLPGYNDIILTCTCGREVEVPYPRPGQRVECWCGLEVVVPEEDYDPGYEEQ